MSGLLDWIKQLLFGAPKNDNGPSAEHARQAEASAYTKLDELFIEWQTAVKEQQRLKNNPNTPPYQLERAAAQIKRLENTFNDSMTGARVHGGDAELKEHRQSIVTLYETLYGREPDGEVTARDIHIGLEKLRTKLEAMDGDNEVLAEASNQLGERMGVGGSGLPQMDSAPPEDVPQREPKDAPAPQAESA